MRMNPASKWSFIQANNPETLAKLVRLHFDCFISHPFHHYSSLQEVDESLKRAIFHFLWKLVEPRKLGGANKGARVVFPCRAHTLPLLSIQFFFLFTADNSSICAIFRIEFFHLSRLNSLRFPSCSFSLFRLTVELAPTFPPLSVFLPHSASNRLHCHSFLKRWCLI